VSSIQSKKPLFYLTPIAAACMLVACGSSGDSTSAALGGTITTLSGVVTSSAYTASTSASTATGDPTIVAGYYKNATVFYDTNGNGVQDSGEPSTTTDANGKFTLSNVTTSTNGQLVADITTNATNTANNQSVPSELLLRASSAQIADQGATGIVISPMSSEVQRLVEANSTDYATEKANVGTRLSMPWGGQSSSTVTVNGADALSDVNNLSGTKQSLVLFEDNALTNRYVYATTKFKRGDKYPDNLAVAGGDPALVGSGATAATIVTPTQTQSTITFKQAQQAAFNIEGIPRYDNIFVIMLENRSVATVTNTSGGNGTSGILGSGDAPYIAGNLGNGSGTGTWNQATTYYATGNPSEPNYTALGAADDWGITDDNWWGCGAPASSLTDVAFSGGTASDGQPLLAHPALPVNTALTPTTSDGTPSGGVLAGYSTTGVTAAADPTACNGTNHNITASNLFTQLVNSGLTWRTYSESMNPGQDPRVDSNGGPNAQAAYTLPSGVTVTGVSGTTIDMTDSLYKTKHHPGMAYQSVRNMPDFYANNRTIFGTQFDQAMMADTTDFPSIPSGYIVDQFSKDLANGDVGQLNFIMPDQCDDMHGRGGDTTCKNPFGSTGGAGNNPLVRRGDAYTQKVIQAIQASPLWSNPQRHVAIVVMFDEGESSSTSCCGWNPSQSSSAQPLTYSNGTYSQTATTNYNKGNHGHGNSIFGVITNHGPTGVSDSDAYSHFSFVRTLQDMFQLADPQKPNTYVGRSKYTEAFIQQNIANLPELAGSADTHFDSVRPMNHAYITPANYTQKLVTGDVVGTSLANRQPGPDANQNNMWAIK
jgi:hypothetical protein